MERKIDTKTIVTTNNGVKYENNYENKYDKEYDNEYENEYEKEYEYANECEGDNDK